MNDDYPHYISVDFTPEFRVKSVTRGLESMDRPSVSDMPKVHGQRTSIPAQAYLNMLRKVEPQDEMSAKAKEKLLAWDGVMGADLVEPTIYSAFRDALLKEVFQHNLGEELTKEAWNPANRGLGMFSSRVKANLAKMVLEGDTSLLPTGDDWPSILARCLGKGVGELRERLGDDMDQWKWERVHRAEPKHNLSASNPELAVLLDPPSIPSSGDADTPLAGGYAPADLATVTGLSVARYAYDLADWDNSRWVIPLGSSGHPGSRHYHDQSEAWRRVEMVPMIYSWERVVAESKVQQRLEPA